MRNVFYLPLSIPEEIIWDQELAEAFLNTMGKTEFIQKINETPDYKEKFLLVSEAMTGDRKNIESQEKIFLEKWLKNKNEIYDNIVSIITSIRALANSQ